MVLCIVLISVGGALKKDGDSDEEVSENRVLYLFLAVFFAILVGVIFSINSVHIFWVINQGYNIDQINYDGNIFLAPVFMVIFFIQLWQNGPIFTLYDWLVAQFSILMVVIGVVLFSRAL